MDPLAKIKKLLGNTARLSFKECVEKTRNKLKQNPQYASENLNILFMVATEPGEPEKPGKMSILKKVPNWKRGEVRENVEKRNARVLFFGYF